MATNRATAEPLMNVGGRGTLAAQAAARATCRMWRELVTPLAVARLVAVMTIPMYTHHCLQRGCRQYLRDELARKCESDPVLARWVTLCLNAAPRRSRPPRVQPCGLLVKADRAAHLVMYAGVLHPGFASALVRHGGRGSSLPAALRAGARAGNAELVELLLGPKAKLGTVDVLRALNRTTDLGIVRIIGLRLDGATYDDSAYDDLGGVLRGTTISDDALRDALAEVVDFPDAVLVDVFRWAVDDGETALARWIHARYPHAVAGQGITFHRMGELASAGYLDALQWAVATLELTGRDGSMYKVLEAAVCADQLAVAQWLVDAFGLSVHLDHCDLLVDAIGEASESVIEWLLDAFPVTWRELAATESDAMRRLEDLLNNADLEFRLKLVVIEGLGIRAADIPRGVDWGYE